MIDETKLSKEQKKIIADLHSPDESVIIDTIYAIRDIGGEYCVQPMIEVFFSTPFENVRQEISRVFVDMKSSKAAKYVLEALPAYMNHKLIGTFISSLWQSSLVFDDVSMFVEKFVNADEIMALDCMSLVENNLGNLKPESAQHCYEIVKNNFSSFEGVKMTLAQELMEMLSGAGDKIL